MPTIKRTPVLLSENEAETQIRHRTKGHGKKKKKKSHPQTLIKGGKEATVVLQFSLPGAYRKRGHERNEDRGLMPGGEPERYR